MDFLGFPRSDGSVGIRNHVLVLPPGLISTSICNFVNGAKTLLTPNFALSTTPRDRETVARTLIGLLFTTEEMPTTTKNLLEPAWQERLPPAANR
jgi:hypothetical protein